MQVRADFICQIQNRLSNVPPRSEATLPVGDDRFQEIMEALHPCRYQPVGPDTAIWSGAISSVEGSLMDQRLLVFCDRPIRQGLLLCHDDEGCLRLVGAWDLEQDRMVWIIGKGRMIVADPWKGMSTLDLYDGGQPGPAGGSDERPDDGSNPDEDGPIDTGDEVTPKPVLRALVVSGGDYDSETYGCFLSRRFDLLLAERAEKMTNHLKDKLGYHVTVLKNEDNTPAPQQASKDTINASIFADAAAFRQAPEGVPKSYFLFIDAHGLCDGQSMDGHRTTGYGVKVVLPSSNNSEKSERVYFDALIQTLINANFPEDTEITIFISACYSGGFITGNAIDNVIGTGTRASFETLCQTYQNLTVYTSTDAVHPSVGWHLLRQNPLDDFFQGDGTLVNNLETMLEEGKNWGATKYASP